MTYFYAQLNNDNVCIGISQLANEVSESNLIPLDFFDESLLNKRFLNGEWLTEETYDEN